jgi:hypothetical protein
VAPVEVGRLGERFDLVNGSDSNPQAGFMCYFPYQIRNLYSAHLLSNTFVVAEEVSRNAMKIRKFIFVTAVYEIDLTAL